MHNAEFERVVSQQMRRCSQLLLAKGKEYAPGATDRLGAFKKAAAIQGCTQAYAALGMMTKHLVSVVDMIRSGASYAEDVWDEKITDSINYLLLIRAIVEEESKSEKH